MNIHFVCRGNTYRSRLAEAYLNSLHISGWSATSSGIEASHALNGDITTYASDILSKEHMRAYTAPTWTQCTKELLEKADSVVFMKPDIHAYAMSHFAPTLPSHEIWNIDDLDEMPPGRGATVSDDIAATFRAIKSQVDEFVAKRQVGANS